MMQRTLIAAAAMTGALVLVGCGAAATSSTRNSHAVAAKLLGSANSSAFATSFQVTFKGGLNMTLTGVSGLAASSQQQLAKLQTELNSGPVSGTIDFQSPTEFRITYDAPAFLATPLQLVEVGGNSYASLNGQQWYREGAVPTGAGGVAPLPSSLTNLPAELKSLGTLAQGGATVTSSGPLSRDGVEVDHIHAVVTSAGLEKIFSSALSTASSSATPSAIPLAGLAQLLQFGPSTGDVYIATKTHLPQEEAFNGGVSVNLGALALLAPSQTRAPRGSLGLTANFSANFGQYRATFKIQTPTDIVPGQLPLPSSLNQLP
ncbi:MAG: hypothetical protein HKL89_03805 [Candidatus Dormibacteraeota bacterium]|nr:hypothetical protein [Candidatus Dormibacteraeota bacterium]